MPSYQFAPSLRKRIGARFLTRVRRELQKAFMEEKASRGMTQAELARILGIDRAVVCRQLAGTSNLTLRTLADYAWALQREPVFALQKRAGALTTNYSGVSMAPQSTAETAVEIPVSRPINVATDFAAGA
jgi:hypothetical protein